MESGKERRLHVLARITKVAESDSHKTKSLSGIEAHSFSQRESDLASTLRRRRAARAGSDFA